MIEYFCCNFRMVVCLVNGSIKPKYLDISIVELMNGKQYDLNKQNK